MVDEEAALLWVRQYAIGKPGKKQAAQHIAVGPAISNILPCGVCSVEASEADTFMGGGVSARDSLAARCGIAGELDLLVHTPCRLTT